MRELLYNAAKHFKRGEALASQGDDRNAVDAFSDALRDLHAVKPQRPRNALLSQVYLSRYGAAKRLGAASAEGDLRMGYSYARTTREPAVRVLAETLWREYLAERAEENEEIVGSD